MMDRYGKMSILLVSALLVLSTGAWAAAPISTIAAGNTVFLGEQGLDITAAMSGDTRIGWWASAASISDSAPSYSLSVPDPANFFVSPSDFSGRTGYWYRVDAAGKSNGIAFIVADPSLDIRVEDATLGYDATNGWIPTGDEIQFRITTNLYQVTQRTGVSAAPIKIVVESPDGAQFSSLTNQAGVSTSLEAIPVDTSPYSTGPIWDTSRRDTNPYGTYRIWAECNINSMKDNYNEAGKTYTRDAGMLYQEQNPLITANTRTVTTTVTTTAPPATTTAVVTTTSVPATTTAVVTTTAVPTTVPTLPPATAATPAPTRSPGFAPVLAGVALLIALAWQVRKE